MTSDIDINRAASKLIEQFGEDAPIRAAMRHDDLLKVGDVDGCVVWKRTLKAIDELQSVGPPEGAGVH